MTNKKSKRNLFEEIKASIDEFKLYDAGKITLKTTTLKILPAVVLTGDDIVRIRRKLNVSRPVFAHALRINPRKLESWEQNRSRVSDEAATLIRLVEKDPAVLDKIRRL